MNFDDHSAIGCSYMVHEKRGKREKNTSGRNKAKYMYNIAQYPFINHNINNYQEKKVST